MNASCSAPYWLLSAAAIAAADSVLSLRWLKGLSVTNTMPALELLVRPLMDRPGNATALSTPGCFSAMSPMVRMTASVRSSEAPLGSWAKLIRYCLSCAGTKPPGTIHETPSVNASSTAYTPMAPALREMTPETPRA